MHRAVSLGAIARLETAAWAVLLALFTAFAVYMVLDLCLSLLAGRWVVMDFFAQWSFARFAWDGRGAAIYDTAALHEFQSALAPGLRRTYPYPYPPTFLLAILPLAVLPLTVAFWAWMGVTFMLYAASLWPRDGAWLPAGLVLLAPAVPVTLAFGQNGFLTAALLLGGFRLLPRHPLLAGIALGLLSFKPQFGVLVPVALLAGGHWRTIAAAAATMVALAIAAGLAFGWATWADWLAYLPAHADYLDAAVNSYRKPTLQAGLLLAGADPALARAAPLIVLALAAALVWWCFRTRSPLAVAALVAGTFAGAPYAFVYDLPAVTAAALVALAARPAGPARLIDGAIVALALAIPAVMTLFSRFYWLGGTAMVLLFGLIVWRAAPWSAPADS